MKALRTLTFLLILLLVICDVYCISKYSEELNVMSDLRTDEKPFRMNKLNLIWGKARKKLSSEKLKMLSGELKHHDKEELTLKRLKSEGQDKDGIKEAELRKMLRAIMTRYDLLEHFEEVPFTTEQKTYNEAFEKEKQQIIYKDKKLNKLWMKAERVGFSEEELKTLKEEFQHHQEKLNEYYEIVNSMPSEDNMDNSVDRLKKNISKDYSDLKQTLKEKHKDLKNNLDRLGKLAALGPETKEFQEPKVKALWDLMINANFSEEELDSLKEELIHFEHRIKKLQYYQSQIDLAEASNKWTNENVEERKRMEQKIKHYSHKVDKLHEELEGRIMQRHLEL